jgi:hypothetical protein
MPGKSENQTTKPYDSEPIYFRIISHSLDISFGQTNKNEQITES